MPQAIPADALIAALQQRGLLASNGRYSPFAEAPPAPDAAVSSALPGVIANSNATLAGTGASGASIAPVGTPDANGNTSDPSLPVSDDTLDKQSEGDALKLLLALGLGSAAAAYLARRRKKLNPSVEDGIPTVEGEVINDPTADTPHVGTVDGEFTDVTATKALSNRKMIAQGATVPDNQGMKALGAPKQVDVPALTKQRARNIKQSSEGNPVSRRTAQQAATRRATRTEPNDLPPIPLADDLSDLTPEERQLANSLTEQLKQNRLAGNAVNRRRIVGDRNLRSTLPTGTVDEKSLLGIVTNLIRSGKIKPQQLGRIVR
jgi:hypothetical protein